METPTSIVKLPRTASRRLGNALPVEVRMGAAELKVAMLYVLITSAVPREVIVEQAVITAWRRCVRWASGSVMRSRFNSGFLVFRSETNSSDSSIVLLLPEEVLRVLLALKSARFLMVSIASLPLSFDFADVLSIPVADIYDCVVPGDIALTFDDGPGIYTDEIVNLLNSYGAKATFFITGINNGKGAIDITPAWNAVIKKMYANGHQLASHTWSHADLSTLTEDARRTEMVRSSGFLCTY